MKDKDIIDWLNDATDNAPVCCLGKTPEEFAQAIVGVFMDPKTGHYRAVYAEDGVLECLLKLNPEWEYQDAVEWYDYNTVRSLPYYDNPPVIIETAPGLMLNRVAKKRKNRKR